MFNKEMNIVKALAIGVVVAGHLNIALLGGIFPPYSFSIAVFFFVAGYFYKEDYETNISDFIVKKFKRLLIPYFLYNLFYALVTVVVFKLNGKVWGQLPTLKNFFIEPFLNGHQYAMSCPLWFVPQLFISLMLFIFILRMLKKVSNNQYFHLAAFLLLAIGAIALRKFNYDAVGLLSIRTLFSVFFIYFGLFYKKYIEGKNIFSFKWFLGVFAFQSLLWLTNKDYTIAQGIGLSYILVWGRFACNIIPIITSLTGIWACVFFAKLISPMVVEGSFVDKVGKNTYHIMANHLAIFYCLTITFLASKGIPLSSIKGHDIYWIYNPIKTSFLYFVTAMFVATYIGEFLKFLHSKIALKFKKS